MSAISVPANWGQGFFWDSNAFSMAGCFHSALVMVVGEALPWNDASRSGPGPLVWQSAQSLAVKTRWPRLGSPF